MCIAVPCLICAARSPLVQVMKRRAHLGLWYDQIARGSWADRARAGELGFKAGLPRGGAPERPQRIRRQVEDAAATLDPTLLRLAEVAYDRDEKENGQSKGKGKGSNKAPVLPPACACGGLALPIRAQAASKGDSSWKKDQNWKKRSWSDWGNQGGRWGNKGDNRQPRTPPRPVR